MWLGIFQWQWNLKRCDALLCPLIGLMTSCRSGIAFLPFVGPSGPRCFYQFIDQQPTLAELQSEGFKLRRPWLAWSTEEQERLKAGLRDIASGERVMHTQNKYLPSVLSVSAHS